MTIIINDFNTLKQIQVHKCIAYKGAKITKRNITKEFSIFYVLKVFKSKGNFGIDNVLQVKIV